MSKQSKKPVLLLAYVALLLESIKLETTGLQRIDLEKDRQLLLTLKGGELSFATDDQDMGEYEALLFLQLATATLYEAIKEKVESPLVHKGTTSLQ